MATSTIYKTALQIADIDRHYYQTHQLTLALHPSETVQRMMYRLAAFAYNADEFLRFGKGLSDDDEPDLLATDYTNTVLLWIDMGQPDLKRMRKACHRSEQVIIYAYADSAYDNWWQQNKNKLTRFDNLQVRFLKQQEPESLESLVERKMRLSCTIQDNQLLLSNDSLVANISVESWMPETT